MNDKIELFQEILAGDPTSKLFYPLAKLYAEAGQTERAADTLRQGLSRHPDHMEARLAVIDALAALGRQAEARTAAAAVAGMLAGHPEFWRIWSAQVQEASADCALAIDFVSAHLAGRCPTFLGLLAAGLAPAGTAPLAKGSEPPTAPPVRPVNPATPAGEIRNALAAEAEVEAEEGEEASLRTRTMADLLFSQEDYAGALDIYEELLGAAAPGERSELAGRIAEARTRLGQPAPEAPAGDDESSEPGAKAVVSTLSALADRLEARARARSGA